MKKFVFASLFLCLVVSAPAFAADKDKKAAPAATATATVTAAAPSGDPKRLGTREDAKRLFDDTMNLFVTDRVGDAFTKLKPNFPLDAAELEAIRQDIEKKRVLMKERFGPSIGFFFLEQDALGDAVMRFVYVEKFERHAIRWLFVVYKPRDQWIVNAVSFDDKLSEHYKPAS